MNEKVRKVMDNMNLVMAGKEKVIEKIIICLLCKGHVLLEDVPGVGKTTLVHTLSKSLDMTFNRVQFTPDLLPSDVTGVSIYNQKNRDFEFKMGPIYNNMVLADEINRTSPKTQSSLLEAMQEEQITVDGNTYELPKPFIVLATQNPIEYEGTFPLPEAQLDRFMMKLSIGYPDRLSEKVVLRRFKGSNPLDNLKAVFDSSTILDMQQEVQQVYVDEVVEDYILDIVHKTREDDNVRLGVSPRGSLALYKAAQGSAYVNRRSYVIPDDVKSLVIPVLSHRMILKSEAKVQGIDEVGVLDKILNNTRVPVVRRHE